MFRISFAAIATATGVLVHAATLDVRTTGTPGNFAYSPNVMFINAGDHLRFQASATHPLGFNLNPLVDCTEGTCTFAFPQANKNYAFFCFNHASMGMTGMVLVEPNDDLIFMSDLEQPLVPIN